MARKAWRELQGPGVSVARCTVERPMRQTGLRGVTHDAESPENPERFGVRLEASGSRSRAS